MENGWINFNDVNELNPGVYLIRRYNYAENRFETELSFVENEDDSLVHRIMKYSDGTKYTWAALSTIVAYKTCDVSDSSECKIVKAAYDPLTKKYIEVGKVDDASFEWHPYTYSSKPIESGSYICIRKEVTTNRNDYEYLISPMTYKSDTDKWYFLSIDRDGNFGFNTSINVHEADGVVYYAKIPANVMLPSNVNKAYVKD